MIPIEETRFFICKKLFLFLALHFYTM